ncbi:MAG TPA: hypothetical protein VHJ78_13255 [Actinomycetota bacterium]|nr:hypothetical protein [Actinomycetota bacterium]
MDGVSGGSLLKEMRETLLLIGIAGSMLSGYLGIALVLFRAFG